MNKVVNLYNEVDKDKERISKLWYKLLNRIRVEVSVIGKSDFYF